MRRVRCEAAARTATGEEMPYWRWRWRTQALSKPSRSPSSMTSSVVRWPAAGSAPSNEPMVRKPSFSSGTDGEGMPRSSPGSAPEAGEGDPHGAGTDDDAGPLAEGLHAQPPPEPRASRRCRRSVPRPAGSARQLDRHRHRHLPRGLGGRHRGGLTQVLEQLVAAGSGCASGGRWTGLVWEWRSWGDPSGGVEDFVGERQEGRRHGAGRRGEHDGALGQRARRNPARHRHPRRQDGRSVPARAPATSRAARPCWSHDAQATPMSTAVRVLVRAMLLEEGRDARGAERGAGVAGEDGQHGVRGADRGQREAPRSPRVSRTTWS